MLCKLVSDHTVTSVHRLQKETKWGHHGPHIRGASWLALSHPALPRQETQSGRQHQPCPHVELLDSGEPLLVQTELAWLAGVSAGGTPRKSREPWEPGAAEWNHHPDQQHGITGLVGSSIAAGPKPAAANTPQQTPRHALRRSSDTPAMAAALNPDVGARGRSQ